MVVAKFGSKIAGKDPRRFKNWLPVGHVRPEIWLVAAVLVGKEAKEYASTTRLFATSMRRPLAPKKSD